MTLKFKEGVTEKDATAFEAAYRLKKLRQAITGFIDYEIAPVRDITSVYEALKKSEIVETVDYNYYGRLLFEPNDPLYDLQWHLGKIKAPAAWNISAGSSAVVVAILDTGIEWAHPDLVESIYLNPNEDAWSNPFNPATGDGQDGIAGVGGNGFVDDWRGWNFLSNNNNTNDFAGPYVQNGHGTRVAGIIAARTHNEEGIAGIAGGKGQGGVKVMPVKIADGNSNSFNFSVVDDAILYAAQNGAKIIHMAFGIEGFTSYPAIDAAIQLAYEQFGVLLVAGSGNTGAAMLTYPASHPYVLSVGASNQYDVRWANSNYGSQLDLAAPGEGIITTNVAGIWGGPYTSTFSAQASGTSLASAMVTGAAALILSEYPCLTPQQVITCLLQTADKTGGYNYNYNPISKPGHSLEMGYGRVNAEDAIKYVKSSLFPPSSTYTTTTYSDANTTLTGIIEMPGHIEITSGATLTFTGELKLLTNAHIIVRRGARLIVDGGTITRKLCFERWGSIYVEGNSSLPQPQDPGAALDPEGPGVVWLRNGARIEYAHNAISVRHYPNHWDSEYWGGLVVAENTVFYNNRRSVEFMKYDLPNHSRFINCEFYDDLNESFAGVTVWATSGINFETCYFSGVGTGILVWDAGAVIHNRCVFERLRTGVASYATSPVSSGEPLIIGLEQAAKNLFINNADHIQSHSTSRPKGIEIFRNEFLYYREPGTFSVPMGIWIDGPSRFSCIQNTFENNDPGILVSNTAGVRNLVQCNFILDLPDPTFPGGYFGVLAVGDNSGLIMEENLFLGQFIDFILDDNSGLHPASIFPMQGFPGKPAHNCFSPQTPYHLITFGNTASFDYYIPDEPSSCIKDPGTQSVLGTNNYEVIGTLNSVPNCSFIPPIAPPQEGPYNFGHYLAAWNSTAYWENLLENNPQNPQIRAAWAEQYLLKHHILDWFLSDAIAGGALEGTLQVLYTENTREAKRLAYGLLLHKGLIARADSALQAIPLNDVYDEQFLAVQQINLARLQSEGAFELTAVQKEVLKTIAYSKSPERGHARALLSLLEGYHFEPDIFELPPAAMASPPELPAVLEQPAFLPVIFPNPAGDRVSIQVPQDWKGEGLFFLHDLYGRQISGHVWNEGQRTELDLTSLPAGVYLLRFEQGGQPLSQQKLIRR